MPTTLIQAPPMTAVLVASLLLVITILIVATREGSAPRFTWADGFVSVLGYRFNCTEEDGEYIIDVADGTDSEEFRNIVKALSKRAAEKDVRRWLATRIAESARAHPTGNSIDDEVATATR